MGEDGTPEGLDRWVADARAADAIDARVRERWLRTQAVESSTLADTLNVLAETGAPVVVTTATGRRHAGRVTKVGADFLAVQQDERVTLISFTTFSLVEPSEPARVPIGGGPRAYSAAGVRLTDVLSCAAGERPRVMLYAGNARVTGLLLAVGADVATVRTDAAAPTLAYVAVGSVSEASFLDSG